MKKPKLSPSSAWLLKLFAERHPSGFSALSVLPDAPKGVAQPHMSQVRGLRALDNVERQLFSTRKEAHLYAKIRNRSKDFSSACREYAGT